MVFWRSSRVIETVEEAREVVVESKERGFEFIKVYNRLGPEVYAAIVETAKKHNLPVDGHVPYDVGFASVVEARQFSVEHLYGASYAMRKRTGCRARFVQRWFREIDEAKLSEYFEKTAKAGLWNSPTLVVNMAWETRIDRLKREPELKYVAEFSKAT